IGTVISKFLQWIGVLESVEDKTRRLVIALEPSASQTRAFAEASQIAGSEITTWSEATKVLAKHNDELRAKSEALKTTVQGLAGQVDTIQLSLKDQVKAMLVAKKHTDLLSKASGLAGEKITDEATALEVLRQTAEPVLEIVTALEQMQREFAESTREATFQAEALNDAFAAFPDQPFLISDVAFVTGIGDLANTGQQILDSAVAGIGDIEGATNQAKSATDVWRTAVQDLDHAFAAFGIDANSTLGQLIAGFSVLAAQIPGLRADLRAGRAVGGALARDSEGNRDFVGAAQGVIGGIGAISQATRQGSTASRTGRGALAGAAAGAQVAGPIGAAIGAVAGAIVGFIRGRRAEGRFREIQDAIGLRVSDALREGIEQAAKDLDIDLQSAALLNLGAAIAEAGGITEENLTGLSRSFSRLMREVA
ncbi:hypothetical protein LCGC14_2750000, partial [marine sediment metagenome]